MTKKTNWSVNFAKYVRELDKTVEQSIKDHEEIIKPKIIAATPKDEGQLRDSYTFTETDNSKNRRGLVQYQIKFGPVSGDNGENYAAEVHEWPANKRWTTPGTGPKFLQRPVLETARDWLPILQRLHTRLTSRLSRENR